MKTKNVKQAMENSNLRVKRILYGTGKIRVDFEPRFSGSADFCSFWIDRAYFARTYPTTYNRFLI